MRSKIIKFGLLLVLPLAIGLVYIAWPGSTLAESADAIAIRIVDNPQHYSSLQWYQTQKFAGSPQSLQIDGYDAIRNNQTAYVNIANVIDKNKDGVLDTLDTNIFIISYTQDIQGLTADIFGQLIKNLKFNTNLTEPGVCNVTSETICINSNECPNGEYCTSQKAKVIRDVKRLADLGEVKSKLDYYKLANNNYPRLVSGTYLANKTISTWPSWQQTLAVELGGNLPIDPINKLGDCPSFDPITCWNQSNQLFATDLSQNVFPSGSHFYYYYSDSQGSFAKYCTQTESNYSNIKALNCFDDKKANSQPIISSVSLFGQPKKEFVGYVSVSDPDGDPLKVSVDLASPDSATWLTKKWRWGTGLNKFDILPTAFPNQKKIYAPYAGNMAMVGYYTVKVTVDDGQGAANSIFSKIYDLTLNPIQPFLNRASKTTVIGNSESSIMSGTDFNGDPITAVAFQSASFNNLPLTQTELQNKGFTVSGMSLNEKFQPTQHTGVYTVNVSASNPSVATSVIESNFSYIIANNPPAFKKLVAYFSNSTSQTCNAPEQCTVAIDNAEKATISFFGADPDGHKVTYSLVDDFSGNLKMDSKSGLISGFEKLNVNDLSDKTFDIAVKISDEYCNNSTEAECSSVYTFSLIVKKFCSLDVPASVLKAEAPQVVMVSKTGETLNTQLNLSDCSVIGTTTADVKFVGESHSQAMVLISDVSKSMDANITVNGTTLPAIDRLKNALSANNTGFIDRIYNIVKNWPTEFFVKVGLVAYNKTVVDSQDLVNLVSPGSITSLKTTVASYSTDYETNTLLALNKAEQNLTSVTDPSVEKIVILMSDGIPGIDGYKMINPSCYTPDPPSCSCGGTYPDACNPWITCPIGQYISSCTTCGTWPPPSCDCGGTYPDCTPEAPCPPGQYQQGCTAETCYQPPHSVYNNFFDIRQFISRLFSVKSVEAVTNQTQCIYQSCAAAFPNFSCSPGDQLTCSAQYTLNCDLTPDVDTQTNIMKNAGISLYTIYYNTSGIFTTSTAANPKQKMCNWSTNNGVNCENNTYAFAGTDIDNMIGKVLSRIVTKPKDVKVAGYPIIDAQPTSITSQNEVSIQGLSCGAIKPVVTFSNNGYLEFSNLKLDYCAAKLHPCVGSDCNKPPLKDCTAGDLGFAYGYVSYPALAHSETSLLTGVIHGGGCDITVKCSDGKISVTNDTCTCRCFYRQVGSTYANTNCIDCGPGYYGTKDGQTSCTLCEAGYYCPDGGCTTLPNGAGWGRLACPNGYTSSAGAKSVSECHPTTVCGDKICNGGESCVSCPGDCPCQHLIECGNSICEYGEDYSSCPNDCPDCNSNSFKQSVCLADPACYWDATYTPRCRFLWEVT